MKLCFGLVDISVLWPFGASTDTRNYNPHMIAVVTNLWTLFLRRLAEHDLFYSIHPDHPIDLYGEKQHSKERVENREVLTFIHKRTVCLRMIGFISSKSIIKIPPKKPVTD